MNTSVGKLMKSFGAVGTALTAPALIALSVLPATATDLAGTWQGTVSMNGRPIGFRVAFTEGGYPLYSFKDNKGVTRTVELATSRQFQYVPPGGGVRTVGVDSIVRRADGVSYVLNIAFEGTNNGYLTQRYSSEQHEYVLTEKGLHMHVVWSGVNYFGDRGGSTGGSRQVETYEGVLQQSE